MEQYIEIMESYNEYLKVLPEGCERIGAHLREESIEEALKLILHFSEGVSWLGEINRLLTQNGVENALQIKQIHEFLEEINNGLEIKDFILVADIFEYEIKPFFEKVVPYNISVN